MSVVSVDECRKETYVLGLAGEYQKMNAALAHRACKTWLLENCKKQGTTFNESQYQEAVIKGLQNVQWPGRSQVYHSDKFPNLVWYLDGAHTEESVRVCVDWINGLHNENK